MVLTLVQFNQAVEKVVEEEETNFTLIRLFSLRTTTKSYIIQCLADREIQKIVKKDVLVKVNESDRAYGHNSKVIHSPHLYSRAEAVDGLGWNSRTSQPIQCLVQSLVQCLVSLECLMHSNAKDKQNLKIQELEKELADKNKEIAYWKMLAESSRENQLRLISDLNRKKCQIDQLLTLNRIKTESAIDKVSNFVTSFFRDFCHEIRNMIAFCWFVFACLISLSIFVMVVICVMHFIIVVLAKTHGLYETFLKTLPMWL